MTASATHLLPVQIGACTLYNADFRDVLPLVGTVDAVITDPPYGDTSLGWDRWPAGWPGMMHPLARTLWTFGSMRMFLTHGHEFAGWKFCQDLVWEKQNGSGFHTDRFRRVHEAALMWYQGEWATLPKTAPRVAVVETGKNGRILRGGKLTHFGETTRRSGYVYGGTRLARSVIRAANCHRRAIHPTQKPLAVILPLVAYSVPVGGVALDPFMGSGSTGEACLQLGRRFIGIERDPRYFEAAVERLRAASK